MEDFKDKYYVEELDTEFDIKVWFTYFAGEKATQTDPEAPETMEVEQVRINLKGEYQNFTAWEDGIADAASIDAMAWKFIEEQKEAAVAVASYEAMMIFLKV